MTEDELLKENADLLRGIENVPPTGDIRMPDSVIFVLERTRKEALAAREKKIVRPSFSGWALRLAAAVVLLAGLGWLIIPRGQPAPRVAQVVVTSPGDAIASTTPEIAWTSKDAPGQLYDVWILPAEGDPLTAPALFKAENVASPVSFATLKRVKGNPDGELNAATDYRVLVCLASAGRMAGVPVSFKVLPARR